jgi:3-oxoacyl-[acyl-carrier protein] reductase
MDLGVSSERALLFAAGKGLGRAAELPVRRRGDPPSFGRAVAFLVSPAAGFITGETLALDGGWIDGMSP